MYMLWSCWVGAGPDGTGGAGTGTGPNDFPPAAELPPSQGTIVLDRVSDELGRGAAWHWGRTTVAAAAFVSGLLALRREPRGRLA